MLRLILAAAVLTLSVPSRADEKGAFIGPGVYATAEGCQKLAALDAGGDRNVGTVPETLTQNGFQGWEGACTFRSVIEVTPGKIWKASLDCHEGAQDGPESDVFERLEDGRIKVTIMGSAMIFERCSGREGR
ncbi:MAG: hypothetical protein ACKVP4_01815 [Hyphomicrobium sp.]